MGQEFVSVAGELLARYNTRERSMERLIMMIWWPVRFYLLLAPSSFFLLLSTSRQIASVFSLLSLLLRCF